MNLYVKIILLIKRVASVAPSVEQRTENPRVGGSIPPRGTISLAEIAQLEHRLAKARRGSNPVFRSMAA